MILAFLAILSIALLVFGVTWYSTCLESNNWRLRLENAALKEEVATLSRRLDRMQIAILPRPIARPAHWDISLIETSLIEAINSSDIDAI